MTRLSAAPRRAWLWFALGAALLSVVFAQAQERKPPDADAGAREETGRIAEGAVRPIDSKPLAEVAREGRRLFEEGRVGPEATLDVTLTAGRNEDGTLDLAAAQFSGSGDETLLALARRFFVAVSQSRVLSVLDGAKGVSLGLGLDRQSASLRVTSELPSEGDAAKYAAGLGAMMAVGRRAKQGTPEGALYEHVSFASDGKVFKMSFEMPRGEAGRAVAELLAQEATRGPQ